MATIRNMTGAVLRFVDANDQVIQTLQPDPVTVDAYGGETIGSFLGVKTRTIRLATFAGLPAQVAGTVIVVKPGLTQTMLERGLARADVWEPEDPVLVNEEICYRAARRYID
jgi:hypothetical protein